MVGRHDLHDSWRNSQLLCLCICPSDLGDASGCPQYHHQVRQLTAVPASVLLFAQPQLLVPNIKYLQPWQYSSVCKVLIPTSSYEV